MFLAVTSDVELALGLGYRLRIRESRDREDRIATQQERTSQGRNRLVTGSDTQDERDLLGCSTVIPCHAVSLSLPLSPSLKKAESMGD